MQIKTGQYRNIKQKQTHQAGDAVLPQNLRKENKMGTWALPQTKQSAEQLAALMAKPLKASKAEAAIYNLLGDDELSDSIHGQIKTDGSNSQ